LFRLRQHPGDPAAAGEKAGRGAFYEEEYTMYEMKPYRKNEMNVWNPFSEMEDWEKHFFNNNDFFGTRALAEFKTDITDEGDHFELKADLPGFRKEDIHLDLDNDVLTIRAERHSQHEDKDKRGKYVRCERSYGAYSRSFDVSSVQSENIKASYAGGVLTLQMPKKQPAVATARHLTID
jgi:HSP20 family protein